MRAVKQLLAILCIVGGAAIVFYALGILLDLPALVFGKHSAEGRDTNSVLLPFLIGGVLALTGLGNLVSASKAPHTSVSASDKSRPEA